MKSTFYKYLVIILGAAFMMSCSSSSDLTSNSIIKKRKYTKGYHADFGKQKVQAPTANMAKQSAEPAPVRRTSLTASADATAAEPLALKIKSNEAAKPISEKVENPALTESTKNRNLTSIAAAPMALQHRDMSKMQRSATASHNAYTSTAAAGASAASGGGKLLYIILAILLPPLAVGLLYGIGSEFWISLLLTLLFVLPGITYAIIKVLAH